VVANSIPVLAQPDQFAATPELGAELAGAFRQQALGDRLRDGETVGVCGVQPVRPRLDDAGEGATDLEPLTDREEPVEQAALVHHLDAANVQAERTGLRGRLGQLLEHDRSHPGQPQLAGQHQPGRSTAGNDHVDHHNPHFRGPRPTRPRRDPRLATTPGALLVESGGVIGTREQLRTGGQGNDDLRRA
jgi:hypothetical protein